MPSATELVARVLPDREPTWTDVAIATMALVWAPVQLLQTTPPWAWIVAGVASVWILLGPAARSTVGRRLDAVFARIGAAGRAVVIAAVAVVLWTAIAVYPASRAPMLGISVGVFAAIPPFVCLHVLVAGRPERWTNE